jgi:hypothetical protein
MKIINLFPYIWISHIIFFILFQADDLEPFDNPKDKDNVHLEFEGIPSKVLTAYDSTQEKISRVVNVCN